MHERSLDQPIFTIPEGTGERSTLDIGGKPGLQLEDELKRAGINISRYASIMLAHSDFYVLEEVTPIELIKLRVSDLGFTTGNPTKHQIFERAIRSRIGDMKLELCRAEVGPHQRLKDKDQPKVNWYYIAHDKIFPDRDDDPGVFALGRDSSGFWLSGGWAFSGGQWHPESSVVFTLRKGEPQTA